MMGIIIFGFVVLGILIYCLIGANLLEMYYEEYSNSLSASDFLATLIWPYLLMKDNVRVTMPFYIREGRLYRREK
jgi:cell shape-determining protein MreD